MRVNDLFDFHARNQPAAPFADDGVRSVTFGEAHDEAVALARALSERVGVGERFGYLSANSVDMAVMFLAATMSGSIPVPLNFRLAPAEWRYIIDDASCRVVIAAGSFVESLDTVRAELEHPSEFVALDADQPDGWTDFDTFVAAAEGASLPADLGGTAALLYQMYTSGTTGRPKGVLLSHDNVMTNVKQVFTSQTFRPGPGDRTLVVAPMYHASGALAVIAAAMEGHSLTIHREFDPAAVVEAMDTGGVTFLTLVPVMMQVCLGMVPGAADRPYAQLRSINYGASPISPELLQTAYSVYGCEMAQGFGQTEAAACLTVLTDADHQRALAGETHLLASVGRPLPGTEIRIFDDDDNEVAAGVDGEIVARGPQVMAGYWNAVEQTEATLRNGWLHTGDVGMVDEHGYLYIRDRKKDMIVSGGSNIYSVEVEHAVAQHPAVADVAVIGIPSDEWGETVLAVVVLSEGEELTLDDLRAFLRDHLGGYKLPRALEVVAALPRNASGKVLKHELREPHWEGRDSRVS